MTRDDKAKIIGNAHLARKESREEIGLLQARASEYAEKLKVVIDALENGRYC